MSNNYHDSAKIYPNKYCKECNFPIVFVCCNGLMYKWSSKYNGPWDWWMYCSNKGCDRHHGEGVFQNMPEWTYNGEK
jgi:hypothetical protein